VGNVNYRSHMEQVVVRRLAVAERSAVEAWVGVACQRAEVEYDARVGRLVLRRQAHGHRRHEVGTATADSWSHRDTDQRQR